MLGEDTNRSGNSRALAQAHDLGHQSEFESGVADEPGNLDDAVIQLCDPLSLLGFGQRGQLFGHVPSVVAGSLHAEIDDLVIGRAKKPVEYSQRGPNFSQFVLDIAYQGGEDRIDAVEISAERREP